MAMFQPETVPIFSYETSSQLNEHFQQRPRIISIAPPPRDVYLMRQEQNNIVPIIAIVSIIGFFGFLAFLVFMKR